MGILSRYLKPSAVVVLSIVTLLLVQGFCDLALPTIMSNIVDVGITNSGIDEPLPTTLTEDNMNLISSFMSEADRADFNSVYQNSNNIYTHINTTDNSIAAYNKASYALSLFLAQNYTDDTLDFNDIYDISQNYDLSDYIAIADSTDPIVYSNISTSYTKMFYENQGIDLVSKGQNYIYLFGGIMLAVALLGTTVSTTVSFLISRLSALVAKKMRSDVFKKVLSFEGVEINQFGVSTLITRSTNDITQLQLFLSVGFRLICYAPILFIGGMIMALTTGSSLSLILIFAVVAIILIAAFVLVVALPKFSARQGLFDRLNRISRESLGGMMVVRAFSNENKEEERFDKANKELTDTVRFINRVVAFLFPIMMFIMNATTLAIFYLGADYIDVGRMQVGNLLAFSQYAMSIIMAFLMIAAIFILVPRAAVSAKRVQEILNTKPTIAYLKNGDNRPVKGLLKFSNVSFKYPGGDDYVLQDISFEAKPCQTTAFIGATGSGKSTIANLIPRYYDVTSGEISIDGVSIIDKDLQTLRDSIGFVAQKNILFTGDIRSNLEFGKSELDDDELLRSLEISQAKQFVTNNADGINMQISQGGANLSGGQKQRISIARALAKDASIFIFDDSFGALDFKTDSLLRRALRENLCDKTVIIVAQRVSTIKDADRILVVDEGRIIADGRHQDLLQSCPQYREIAESQNAVGGEIVG